MRDDLNTAVVAREPRIYYIQVYVSKKVNDVSAPSFFLSS